MSAFATWLLGFARTFVSWLYNSGIDTINVFIKGLCAFIVSLASLLPSGNQIPVLGSAPSSSVMSMTFQVLNWLFPMTYLASVVAFVATGLTAYFAVSVVLRWFKVLT